MCRCSILAGPAEKDVSKPAHGERPPREERGNEKLPKDSQEEVPKIVHMDVDLWNKVRNDFKGGSRGRYKEALEEQQFRKAKSMLLQESRKGCGMRSTTKLVFPEVLDRGL